MINSDGFYNKQKMILIGYIKDKHVVVRVGGVQKEIPYKFFVGKSNGYGREVYNFEQS